MTASRKRPRDSEMQTPSEHSPSTAVSGETEPVEAASPAHTRDISPTDGLLGIQSSTDPSWSSFHCLCQQWERPGKYRPAAAGEVPAAENDMINFFLVDVEHSLVRQPSHAPWVMENMMPLARENPEVTVITLFGVTVDGDSVVAHVHGINPYLYVETAVDGTPDPVAMKRKAETILETHSSGKNLHHKVLSVDVVRRESLLNYKGPDGQRNFYKITLADQRSIAGLRNAVEQGIQLGSQSLPRRAYEANIPLPLRFLVDHEFSGCSWIRLPRGSYTLRNSSTKVSRCTIELDVDHESLEPLPVDGEWQLLPPKMRILSFDIECVTLGRKGFPTPENDPVIQIAIVVKELASSEPDFRVVLCLRECAALPGAAVVWFKEEIDLLRAFTKLFQAADPDVVIGYNCFNFDLWYLITRARTLRVTEFVYLTRYLHTGSKIRDSVLSSRALGTHENKDINLEGRVSMDMLEVVRRDHKLKSYSLNTVSAHFLGQQKEDVHYSIIGDLFNGTPENRRRVASYCLKDAVLPLRLLDKLLVMFNYVEMSRVTGTPINYLLTRGQQIKVTSQLLRKCRQTDFLMPTMKVGGPSEEGAAYEGATVLDPLKGFYKNPIATLDFASLYPSIMMAHNLCYTTLITAEPQSLALTPDDITVTPVNASFVKSTKRKGILPMIVEELISARKRAKKAMGEAEDYMTKMVLNGRQLALKITANSVYGYTGATAGGQLPCLEISTSITGYGRQMIDLTKESVELRYRRDNGYKDDAVVIYGDTDSVMVDFGTPDVAEAMRLGQEAASRVSQKFIKPIALEFEKVFCPYLLMNKKRYAGLLWTKPEKWDKIDCKGIETVRRDFCELVQQTVDEVLKKLLIHVDVDGAKDHVRQTVSDILQNKVDMSMLLMSKSLGKEDYTAKLAHVELAKKLRKRDPGNAPQIGDRVHYVIIAGGRGQPQYDRAEDPLFVLENNLSIDTNHYLDALKNPLIRIFDSIMDNPEALFSGSHTLATKKTFSASGALSKFVKTQAKCLGCRLPLKTAKDGGDDLCERCREKKETEVVLDKTRALSSAEKEFNQLWVQCQRCQGSTQQDVICTSRDCPIFYRRTKAKKDLHELTKQVENLCLVEW